MSLGPKYWPIKGLTDRKHIEVHLNAIDEAYEAVKDMPASFKKIVVFNSIYDESVMRQIDELTRSQSPL